ncbi:hypothetical protein MS2017_1531 [Bathymodiolus thermophilus thioautotrophic gill symbiont]|uniref:F5/8 type C domain-containing protein n=1 Tax=Bathymodiolus thermophilus thioautotrophic gill symbiont TaxID=2360 RepID=A0A3G3IMW2_9GAMM|nr:discoidin domain-containing protein [Bathymodiolus thermophilus thioautotrophic gill symbiont]AYQ57216.1 hypothetical protein MS2017_1531 [Bathymodiolus thermophilus thioautotrophic gill symbiont]
MNIYILKKTFFRALLIGIAFIALSAHATTHFIPGFLSKQPVAIPNIYLINANNIVTKITGKLGGSMIGGNGVFDFTAIKLQQNLFLAQATVGAYKKGVFFEVNNNYIKATAARYCPLAECVNRNLALTDTYNTIASSPTLGAYGVFDLTLSITHINSNQNPMLQTDFTYPEKSTSLKGGNEEGNKEGNEDINRNTTQNCSTEGSTTEGLVAKCQNHTLGPTVQQTDIGDISINPPPLTLGKPIFTSDNELLISVLITTQPTPFRGSRFINANHIITKITGKFIDKETNNGGGTIDFTAIRLKRNLFLAQVAVGVYKKGVFFEIEDKKIKANAARYCLLTECQNRNLALTDKFAKLATLNNRQITNGYGIFDLILSTTYFNANQRFVPGFITTQGVTVSDYTTNKKNIVTKITGKLGGSGIDGDDKVDFTAIKLDNKSFLAQTITAYHKKGVFFEMEGNKIKVTAARYCALTICQDRNVTLTDAHVAIASSQITLGYGVFDLVLLIKRLTADQRFIPDFVTTQGIVVPNYVANKSNIITKITGKFGGSGMSGGDGNFTAIKLDGKSFLAQTVMAGHKKGVFFEMENNKIKVIAARYCALTVCQNRDVALTDTHATIASSKTVGEYGIFDLILSIKHLGADQYLIPDFVTTQGIVVPSYAANRSNVITKITGKFGGSGINGDDKVDFTAIKLDNKSFLAQTVTANHKKGVFFEIEGNKIKVTAARYCALTICQDRNVALTDTHVAIADGRIASGYGIFDLILSIKHFNADQHFIPDFVTTQGIVIPNYVANKNAVITEITGKFGGSGMSGSDGIDFIAIELDDKSFLAQTITANHKKGVFFEIEDNKVRVTAVRYCILTVCQDRNVALTDTYTTIASSKTVGEYGIFDLILTITYLKSNERFTPSLITTQGVVIPDTHLINVNQVITKITGKFSDDSTGGAIDFTAIKLGNQSFLAQIVTANHKKGVFFKIEGNKIKATAARSCSFTVCLNGNVKLADTHATIANRRTADGYGIFNLILTTTYINFNEHFIPNFITTQGVVIPKSHLINANNIVTKITGKFSYGTEDRVVDFTAIKLGNQSFLAQIVTDNRKKGVFFEIEGDKIKVTAARYCHEVCQYNDVALTNYHTNIANSQANSGYGIFDLILTTTHINPNEHFIPDLITTQGIILNAHLANANNVVTKITGKFRSSLTGKELDFTAIKLNGSLFLAQITMSNFKEGMFFEIEGDKIKVIAARYCSLVVCQNRNLVLTDPYRKIANSHMSSGYKIFNLIVSIMPLNANEHFIPNFVTTFGVAIPNATLINASNIITKITGKFGGASISDAIDFTAIKLGDNAFLAQITTSTHKKGIFFKIENNSVKATAARYCALTVCQNRILALTDSSTTITSDQTVGAYGIFNLILSTTRINKNNHFVPGFVTTQGVAIPNAYSINESNPVTFITGRMGGGSISTPIEFIAIKLGDKSFLAQVVEGLYKKGVFFEMDNNNIKVTHARYCILTECQNRNLSLTDKHMSVATSPESNGYGVFDLMLSTTFTTPNFRSRFISGFVAKQPRAIPNAHRLRLNKDHIISKITGKLAGLSIGGFMDFTAIKISNHSFLAQGIGDKYKKGVFFEIRNNNEIVATAARYCLRTECQNRNLRITDHHADIANSKTTASYGIFDLTLTITPLTIMTNTASLIPGFVSNQPVAIPNFLNYPIIQIIGKFGGASIRDDTTVGFTAIKLGDNLFLAQIIQGIYKKGIFFEIDNNGRIKVTQARYCLLTECQNRNLSLTDKYMGIATDSKSNGYGIFDLKITSLINLALNKTATQSSTYYGANAHKAVDGNTNGNILSKSVSHTKLSQGAWWKVDLDGPKLIQQIRIFNRTDCCKNRLAHYQVSIANDANFVTTTYRQEFRTYPDPEKSIDLSLPSIQGSYVKIQLLNKNYLALAEVQVLGHHLVSETSD